MTQPDEIRIRSPETQPESGGADPGRMLQILWRGKWILLLVPLLALGATRLWLSRQTKLYQATAQVQVDARQVNPLKSGAGEAINKPRTVLKQQQSLLKSTTLLKRLAESPALADLATFDPARLGDQTKVGALYESLQTGIDVESDRLFISFLSPYRAEAIVVVDEALRTYIDYHKKKKREAAEGLEGIVRVEWEAAKRELEEASAAIAELQSKHTLLAGTDRIPLQTKLDSANTALDAAHKETQQARSVFEDMRAASQDPARFRERGLYWRAKGPIGALEERTSSLKNEREAKEAELERLERSVGPENAHLVELRAAIDALRAKEDDVARLYAEDYLRNSELELLRAIHYEDSLASDVQTLLAQVTAQNDVLDRIKDLQIERDHLRERVAGFDERITQLELENQTGALNLDVIEYARAGVRPVYPEVEKTMIYALGGSGILAFALVLLLGLADRRVREVEDLPRLLGTSVLGVLPRMPNAERAWVARVVEEQPLSLASEAFRNVRAATVLALPAGRGVVLVTSASAGEGKSVCASNLAFAFARSGKRTLLVDADMRKPVQHRIYDVDNAIGLAGLLSTSVPVKKAIAADAAFGLDLLPAGESRARAAELCEAPVLCELLNSLRATYECIVIDAPSVLETSEARVLASLADRVVLVLRLDESKIPHLRRAIGLLRGAGARIVGCLPNSATSQRGARDFAGGISLGEAPERGPRPVPAVDAHAESEAPHVRARGTDFLGLEEESA